MRSSHLQSDSLRSRLHQIIFEADTPAGKAFDVALLGCILISVVTVSLESVASIRDEFGALLRAIEWVLTALFTLEYFLRLYSVHRPSRYATSFFGLVDLLAVIPTYLSLLLPGAQSLLLIRALRLLRVFRVLKLVRHSGEAKLLMAAMRASRPKITVFLGAQIIISPYRWGADVSNRKFGGWFHEHPPKRLLGDRDDDDGRLWRHRTADRAGTVSGKCVDDSGVLDHSRAYRHRDRRVGTGETPARQHPGLPFLFGRRTRR